jgi:hypothetical protein
MKAKLLINGKTGSRHIPLPLSLQIAEIIRLEQFLLPISTRT